jgi:Stress responsive A/B Barrel Domain
MLRHVVLLRWKEGATEAEKAAVEEGLRALPAAIPEIRRYELGPDAGLAEGNFDLALVADFDSAVDFATYQTHPEHLRLLSERVRPAVAARAAAQYRLPTGGRGATP